MRSDVLFSQKPIPAFSAKVKKEVFLYARRNLAKIKIYIKDPYVSLFVTEEKFTEVKTLFGNYSLCRTSLR